MKSTWTFCLAFLFNLISVLFLVIGISIWTVLVQQVQNVNSAHVRVQFCIRDHLITRL